MNNNLINLATIFHLVSFLIIPVVISYVIFAFILSRQVKLLNKSFSSPAAPALAKTATLHLIASMVIAFLALLSL